MILGAITKSDSLVSYLCQVYRPGDVEVVPCPADYAFGRFVKIALDSPLQPPAELGAETQRSWSAGRSIIGVICNTILSGLARTRAVPASPTRSRCRSSRRITSANGASSSRF